MPLPASPFALFLFISSKEVEWQKKKGPSREPALHSCTFINRCLPVAPLVCHASYDHRRLHAEASSPFQVPKRKKEIHEANWHLSLSHQICAYMYTHLLHMCTADLNTCMYSVETQFSIYHRNVPTEEQGCNDWATLMLVYCLLNWKSLSEIRTDICFCKCIGALRLLTRTRAYKSNPFAGHVMHRFCVPVQQANNL